MIVKGVKISSIHVFLYKAWCAVTRTVAFKIGLRMRRSDSAFFVSTPEYSDNSRVFCDFLLNRSYLKETRFIWIADTTHTANKIRQKGLACCRRLLNTTGPIIAFKAARSRYVFCTHGFFPGRYRIPEEQIVVNLWHGCGYKNTGRCETAFSYALVPGELFVDIKAKSFSCPKEKILALGYPRYDLLIHPVASLKLLVKKLGLPQAEQYILWLPTFRKHATLKYAEEELESGLGLPLIQDRQSLEALDNTCANLGVTLIIKRHPSQVRFEAEKYSNSLKAIKFIDQDVLNELDVSLYEVMAYTNALISDYSSAAIDYLLLNRPIGYVLEDFDLYKAARGFSMDDPLKYMPGAHIASMNDLVGFIKKVSEGDDSYSVMRDNIRRVAHNPCDCYCQRLADVLELR